MIDSAAIGIDPRFRVDAELASRPGLRLFRVFDRLSGVERRLRLGALPAGVQSARSTKLKALRRTFEAEYFLLSDIRHPHIVRAFDFGVSKRGFPYFSVESAVGVQIDRWPGSHDGTAMSTVTAQLLQALSTLHARGFGGCAIEAKRVLVAGPAGAPQAMLIDVSDVVKFSNGHHSPAALIRSDLLQLGRMVHKLLVPVAQLNSTTELKHPHEWDPTIPLGLSKTIMGMCRLVPDSGSTETAEVFNNTRAVAEALTGNAGHAVPLDAWTQRLVRSRAVSHREAEVREVMRWADTQIRAQAGGVLLVIGPEGIGKTPFLNHIATEMTTQGFRVIRLMVDPDAASPVPPILRALKRVSMQDLPPSARDKSHIFVKILAERLNTAFGDRPTAIFVDDLHHADRMGLTVLEELARACAGSPIVWIGAAEDPALLKAFPSAESCCLNALSMAQVRELAAHRLHGLELPEMAARRINDDSQGRPSLVERSLTQMVDEGTIVDKSGLFTFVGGRYRIARYAERRERAALLHTLPESECLVLKALAIMPEATVEDISSLSEQGVDDVYAPLKRLQDKRLVRVGTAGHENVYTQCSKFLRDIILDTLGELGERVHWHDRASALLQARSADANEHELRGSSLIVSLQAATLRATQALAVFSPYRAVEVLKFAEARMAAEIVSELGSASPVDAQDKVLANAVLSVFCLLGDALYCIGSRRAALRRYQQAIQWANLPDTEQTVLLKIGPLALGLGEEDTATSALEKLLTLQTTEHIGDVACFAAELAAHKGEWRIAIEGLEKALENIPKHDPERVRLHLYCADLWRKHGEILLATRAAHRALNGAKKFKLTSAEAEAHTVLARGFVRVARYDSARRSMLLALRAARRARDKVVEATVMREIGNLYLRRGDYVEALQRYQRGLELSRRMAVPTGEIACLHNMGIANFLLGRFAPALTSLRRASTLARENCVPMALATCHVEIGHVLAEQGRWSDARVSLEAGMQQAKKLDDETLWAESAAILAWVAVREGDDTEYRTLSAPALHHIAAIDDPAVQALSFLYFGRAAFESNDVPLAKQFAENLRKVVDRSLLQDFSASAFALRGCIAHREGKTAEALKLWREGLRFALAAGMLGIEVSLRADLGKVNQYTEQGMAHLTRAMQVMRLMCSHMESEAAQAYLRRAECQDIREAFVEGAYRLKG